MASCQKLGISLENKVIWKLMLSKNVNNKKFASKFVFFNEKKSERFGWFLKVKFWHLLTARHYSNYQNLVISFHYSWFLTKHLSNFVSLPWKLHNRYCHNSHLHNYCKNYRINLNFIRFTARKIINHEIATVIVKESNKIHQHVPTLYRM